MSIYKRGRVYWFKFRFKGELIQHTTRQGNPRVARQIEAAHRTSLAKGEVGIVDRKPAPTLKQFAERFLNNASIGSKKPQRDSTMRFYANRVGQLLTYDPLASCRLDAITPELVEHYIRSREPKLSPSSLNGLVRTLRRCLQVAFELGDLTVMPKRFTMREEKAREYVLSPQDEPSYLAQAPQPLLDMAILMLDAGTRVGEACNLQWPDIHLEPTNGYRYGWIHIREGKSSHAVRNIPLTKRVAAMLQARSEEPHDGSVFWSQDSSQKLSASTVSHQHTTLRRALGMPEEFVLHSLRHTSLTRWAVAGVDAFTMRRLAGHHSVTVSEKYVHSGTESAVLAVDKLEALNARNQRLLATISATPETETGQ